MEKAKEQRPKRCQLITCNSCLCQVLAGRSLRGRDCFCYMIRAAEAGQVPIHQDLWGRRRHPKREPRQVILCCFSFTNAGSQPDS